MALELWSGLQLEYGSIIRLTQLSSEQAFWNMTSAGYYGGFTREDAPVVSFGENIIPLIKDLAVGQNVTYNLVNGGKLIFERGTSLSLFAKATTAEGVGVSPSSLNYYGYEQNYESITLSIASDPETHKAFLVLNHTYVPGYATGGHDVWLGGYYLYDSWGPLIYNAIVGSQPVDYLWMSISGLYSDRGNLPLSMIPNEYMNDGFQVNDTVSTEFFETHFTQRPAGALISGKLQLMNPGDVISLGFAGENEVTMEFVSKGEGTKDIRFKYYENGELIPNLTNRITVFDTQDIYLGYITAHNGEPYARQDLMLVSHPQPNQVAIQYNTEASLGDGVLADWYRWLGDSWNDAYDPDYTDFIPEPKPDGGDGSFYIPDEEVPIPRHPALEAINTGFCRVYVPTSAELAQLSRSLLSPSFSEAIDHYLFGNVMDIITGLSVIAVDAPSNSRAEISAGNIETGVEADVLSTQYIDCIYNEIEVPKFIGSYFAYAPYVKIKIWLPFIGWRDLDPNDCVGRKFRLRYTVDILSGACAAYISTSLDNDKSKFALRYSYIGQCSYQIPINSANYDSMISSIVSLAGSAATAVAGISAGGAGVAVGISAMTAGVNAVSNSRPNYSHGGTASSIPGFLSKRTPYIIMELPNVVKPKEYDSLKGTPSMMYRKLSNLSGYTEVLNVHIEGFSATNAEKAEIETLLKEGVIL